MVGSGKPTGRRRSRHNGGHVGLRAPGGAGVLAGQVRDAVSQVLEADGVPFLVTSAAVADEQVRGAGELTKEASSAVRLRRNAAKADRQPDAGAPGHDLPALADMLIRHLFAAGLAVQSAAALADGPVAAELQQVTDRLDGIICATRTAVFESQAPEHRCSPQAS